MKPLHALPLLAALTLFARGPEWAQAGYTTQVIARGGDRAGDVLLPPGFDYLEVVGLNDSGEIVFYVDDQSVVNGETVPKWSLIEASGGGFKTILRAGDTVDGIPIN